MFTSSHVLKGADSRAWRHQALQPIRINPDQGHEGPTRSMKSDEVFHWCSRFSLLPASASLHTHSPAHSHAATRRHTSGFSGKAWWHFYFPCVLPISETMDAYHSLLSSCRLAEGRICGLEPGSTCGQEPGPSPPWPRGCHSRLVRGAAQGQASITRQTKPGAPKKDKKEEGERIKWSGRRGAERETTKKRQVTRGPPTPASLNTWAVGRGPEGGKQDALTGERARRWAARETVTRSRVGVGQLDTQMYSERASFPWSHVHYPSPSGGDPEATATAWTPSSGESKVRGAERSGTERTLGFWEPALRRRAAAWDLSAGPMSSASALPTQGRGHPPAKKPASPQHSWVLTEVQWWAEPLLLESVQSQDLWTRKKKRLCF